MLFGLSTFSHHVWLHLILAEKLSFICISHPKAVKCTMPRSNYFSSSQIIKQTFFLFFFIELSRQDNQNCLKVFKASAGVVDLQRAMLLCFKDPHPGKKKNVFQECLVTV